MPQSLKLIPFGKKFDHIGPFRMARFEKIPKMLAFETDSTGCGFPKFHFFSDFSPLTIMMIFVSVNNVKAI